jgi:acyl-CoA thioester hydrolase|tara:strand:+ start:38360 stop:38809 length:450 start_codon:yes stop_codon:yes gene_type:complete
MPDSTATLPWIKPPQATLAWTVTDAQTDHFAHTNNAEYVRAMERCAWVHTEALGLSFEAFQRMGAGCVVHRHEIDYLAPTLLGEALLIGTWIDANDGRLSMRRGFQIVRLADRKTVLRAMTQFVCVDLASGRPRRMPPAFVAAYQPVAD